MFQLRGPLLCALLVGALTSQALHSQITGITPPEGQAGTSLHITGSGFGTGKPKVSLQAVAGGKSYKLKVTAWSDDSVTAVIHHGTPGPLMLRLKPKAAGAPAFTAPFVLHGPEPVAVYPAIAGRGDKVALLGPFLGSAKLKIRIGGKPAKPSWPSTLGPTCVIPASLPYGVFDVSASNPIGSATLPAALTLADPGPPLGAAQVVLHVDGGTHVFSGEHLFTSADSPITRLMLFTHDSGNGLAGGLQLELWYEPHVTPLPASYHDEAPAGTFTGGPLTCFQGSHTPYPSWGHASPWQISVDAASGGQIAGTFSGVCHHASLPDKVVSGSYVVTLPTLSILAASAAPP